MGLLDDAIKQHLELKRKHGAPEEELQRQQEEALGPVRREAAPQPESVEAEAGPAEGDVVVPEVEEAAPAAVDGDGEQLFDGEALETDEPSQVQEVPAAEPPAPLDEDAPAAAAEPPLAEPVEPPVVEPPAEPVLQEDPEAPEPGAASGDTPEHGLDPVAEPPRGTDPDATMEYDPFADEEPEEEQPAAEEDGDVLEDTPDFLQETPEHDRLWFEQKPPRDFDFE
jgi:hypothetical protein